jgi:hypothetical protein
LAVTRQGLAGPIGIEGDVGRHDTEDRRPGEGQRGDAAGERCEQTRLGDDLAAGERSAEVDAAEQTIVGDMCRNLPDGDADGRSTASRSRKRRVIANVAPSRKMPPSPR